MENKKLILIIDDEPDFVKTMQFYLENSNFRVLTAFDGRDGLEKARNNPDLILLDLRMPGMSGHQVSKHLKEDKATQHIPIIMLTSQDETIDKVEALDMGVADYVGKTFPLEEILARVKAALRERSPDTTSVAVKEREKRIASLNEVIDQKKIRILYQPIMEISSRGPIGYEAFLSGPQGTPLESQAALFNAALEAGVSGKLDALYRSLAVKRAKFLVSGNILFFDTDQALISAEYFQELSFLNDSPIPTSQICLQIGESAFTSNAPKLAAELARLKSKGVKIAIHDVKTDYSGLKAIEKVKPDYVKIDIGLVRCIDIDEIKKNLVETIVRLAQKLNCRLIAEGVEAEYECKTLLSTGVNYGQGPLFGRPSEEI
jgi:EAL domain-containing protein (putative c-di-GMP-specific phosphodiesterase class I)/CheY-like chemotaxis protein